MVRSACLALTICASTACGDSGALHEAPTAELRLVEDLRIGSRDEPNYALTDVYGLLPLDDGGVWVNQLLDRDFRRYGADGAFRGRMGGRGEGPGEFSGQGQFGWWDLARDTIWVIDQVARRLSLFTADGAFVRSFSTPDGEYDGRRVRLPDVVLQDRSALGRTFVERDQLGFRVLRYELETGVVRHQVARIERADQVPGIIGLLSLPFPNNELVGFSPDGSGIVVVDRKAEGPPTTGLLPIHFLNANGDTLWSRTCSFAPYARCLRIRRLSPNSRGA